MESKSNGSFYGNSITTPSSVSALGLMSVECNSDQNYALSSTPMASLDLQDGEDTTESSSNSATAFKRWNSMPGINFSYNMRCPEPSPSSSISGEEDNDESNNSEQFSPCIERKSVSFSKFDGRPSESSPNRPSVSRNRSISNVFYLPYRLLDKGIEKLKREANVRRCIETDYAGEKMSVTGAALMYSMDEFSIDEGGELDSSIGTSEQRRRTQSLTEPVHVLTNLLPASCSPSPTRIEKQCYSPSMQSVVRSIAMSPSPTPSPSRRQGTSIRSLSPIATRAGMSLKRKNTMDSDACPSVLPKRANYSVPTTPLVSAEDIRQPPLFGLPVALQALNHSLSESSIDSECSISTIGSDYTTVSNSNHVTFHSRCPMINRATTSSPVISSAPASSGYSSVTDCPIPEESTTGT